MRPGRSILTGANERMSFVRLVDEPKRTTAQDQREDEAYACGPEPFDYENDRDDR
jgi:hypothetical protein